MIVVVCSVCKSILRYHLDGKDEIIESHGLCPECYAAEERKLDRWEQTKKDDDADGTENPSHDAG